MLGKALDPSAETSVGLSDRIKEMTLGILGVERTELSALMLAVSDTEYHKKVPELLWTMFYATLAGEVSKKVPHRMPSYPY